MALELITGRAGKAHVGSEDVRAYNAQTAGGGRYVLDGGEATIQSANEVKIAPAELLVDGAHVRITGTGEVVNIDNGASSYKRVDIIALHYKRTGGEDDAIETMELVAVKGTPADDSPADPEMPATGSILDDVAETYIPYARVLIDGLTPQAPTVLLTKYALPEEHGGTGARSIPTEDSDPWDGSLFVMKYASAAGLYARTGARVWNWIASKVRSVFGFSSSDVLAASHGGTGQTSLQATRNAMGLGNTTGALPVANGGTGSADAAGARSNLGLGSAATMNIAAKGDDPRNKVATIAGDGVMEVGEYIDFHVNGSSSDFDLRMQVAGDGTLVLSKPLPVAYGGTGMEWTVGGDLNGGVWRRFGNVVVIHINTTMYMDAWSDINIGTLPEGSRPAQPFIGAAIVENGQGMVRIIANPDGSVHLMGTGGNTPGGNGKYGSLAFEL